jgi:hypothetical protein
MRKEMIINPLSKRTKACSMKEICTHIHNMTIGICQWSHAKGSTGVDIEAVCCCMYHCGRPLGGKEQNSAISLSNVMSSCLGSRRQVMNDGTDSVESAPSARKIIGVDSRINGWLRSLRRKQMREGKVLKDTKFPRCPSFGNHRDRRSLKCAEKRMQIRASKGPNVMTHAEFVLEDVAKGITMEGKGRMIWLDLG